MKKVLFSVSVLLISFIILDFGAWAQEEDVGEFSLEEITVTAEKREINVQKIPASVQAIVGAKMVEQGKITTEQFLEGVPNVRFERIVMGAGTNAASPDGTIAIRGLRIKETSNGQPPPTTATYVDGVFQGIGGNYDVNRIEVLRGPQGTLYGRSATGGVVAFHTNNPRLSEFSGNAFVEVGEASLMNVQAAVNAPVGNVFAVRAAGHYLEQDGYFNPDGDHAETREGRIKAYYKPSEAFDITLSLSLTDRKNNSGGNAAGLSNEDPNKIIYDQLVTDVVKGNWRRSTQGSLSMNYDFGNSILTYIGGYHDYIDQDNPGRITIRPGVQIREDFTKNNGEIFRTHEMRLASDWDKPLTWLIGSSYYYSTYDRVELSSNKVAYIDGVVDPDPHAQGAIIFGFTNKGNVKNLGIFTEETYRLQDNMRITAGLRYDKTDLTGYSSFDFNQNRNDANNATWPEDFVVAGTSKSPKFDNFTYKLRFEYDVTPDNMLYIMTATGFQPGDVRLSVIPFPTVSFEVLPFNEEKLTSYEIGSKNRFLDNRLQMNASAFYYDYEQYRVPINIAPGGPPIFITLATDLRIFGVEFDADWMVTMYDRVAFSFGWLDAKIAGYPDVPALNPTKNWLWLERVPGISPLTANLSYERTFNLPNGSTLAPRGELRYTQDYYVEQMNKSQVDAGLKPWAHQDSYVIADIGATWTSPSSMYSATAYLRNAMDTEYKKEINMGASVNQMGVTPGDPRAWGLVVSAKF